MQFTRNYRAHDAELNLCDIKIVSDQPHRAELDPTHKLDGWADSMTGQMIPGFTRCQKSETMSFSVTSISKKNSIFVSKGLKYSKFNRACPSHAFSDRTIFFLSVAGQIPPLLQQGIAPKHAWNQPYRGCYTLVLNLTVGNKQIL